MFTYLNLQTCQMQEKNKIIKKWNRYLTVLWLRMFGYHAYQIVS